MKKVIELLVNRSIEQDARIKELEKTVEKQEDLLKDLFFRYKEIIQLIEQ